MRKAIVLIHRWGGLAITFFLLVLGITGCTLAFYHELDRGLNPQLLSVPEMGTALLDPLTLLEKAEALEPNATVDRIDLQPEPGEAFLVWLKPKINPETGKCYVLDHDQLFLNPYTGAAIGVRQWGAASLASENLLPFIYRIHYSLALPWNNGRLGEWLLGLTAVAWTADCFFAFFLTLPAWRRSESNQRSWWQRWLPSWRIKPRAGPYRTTLDLHRASGLWLWPMLLVLAWSGVAFNLADEVYRPVMGFFFTIQSHDEAAAPTPQGALSGWREARERGRNLMRLAAARHRFVVEEEQSLSLDRTRGVYKYLVRSSDDIGTRGNTRVAFDARTGALNEFSSPSHEATGDAITRWLIQLHTGRIFGFPMQLLLCVTGLFVVLLSITGIAIWERKRRARSGIRPARR